MPFLPCYIIFVVNIHNNMFSKGQLFFAGFFVITFVIAMIWSYSKDKKHQDLYYKNIWKVGLVIVLVIAVFAVLTFWIHE